MPIEQSDTTPRRARSTVKRTKERADYEIRLPSLSNFFKTGAPKDPLPEQVKERIQRMREEKSPVPEPLRWIPKVINFLDDAQDLLYSAAYMARPLLKTLALRVGTRFIPYVGWGLLILDAVNLVNNILGIAMTPGVKKPGIWRDTKSLKNKLDIPNAAFWNFINKGGWRFHMGAMLQMAQASATVTGYGLQLGALFGTMSDAIWGAVQAARGKKVVWTAPEAKQAKDPKTKTAGKQYVVKSQEEMSIKDKAAKFMTQLYQHFKMFDILSPEDHELIIAATNIAAQILSEGERPYDIDNRFNIMCDQPYMHFQPWNPISRKALKDMGIDPDIDQVIYDEKATEDWTYNNIIATARKNVFDWMQGMAKVFAPDIIKLTGQEDIRILNKLCNSTQGIHQNVLWWLTEEAGESMFQYATDIDIYQYYQPNPEVLATYHLGEYFSILGPIQVQKYRDFIIKEMEFEQKYGVFSWEYFAERTKQYFDSIGTGAAWKPWKYQSNEEYKQAIQQSYEKEKKYKSSLSFQDQRQCIYVVKNIFYHLL